MQTKFLLRCVGVCLVVASSALAQGPVQYPVGSAVLVSGSLNLDNYAALGDSQNAVTPSAVPITSPDFVSIVTGASDTLGGSQIQSIGACTNVYGTSISGPYGPATSFVNGVCTSDSIVLGFAHENMIDVSLARSGGAGAPSPATVDAGVDHVNPSAPPQIIGAIPFNLSVPTLLTGFYASVRFDDILYQTGANPVLAGETSARAEIYGVTTAGQSVSIVGPDMVAPADSSASFTEARQPFSFPLQPGQYVVVLVVESDTRLSSTSPDCAVSVTAGSSTRTSGEVRISFTAL
jgi:hypothetical protein